jgi:hypothetical protein
MFLSFLHLDSELGGCSCVLFGASSLCSRDLEVAGLVRVPSGVLSTVVKYCQKKSIPDLHLLVGSWLAIAHAAISLAPSGKTLPLST